MKILFLTHPYPNYSPDLLLHGLRKLYGPDVVDFPKKNCLYSGLLGQPFLEPVPNLFEDYQDIDRTDPFVKIAMGFFDVVFIDVRACKDFLYMVPDKRRLVLVDGEDTPTLVRGDRPLIVRREHFQGDSAIPMPMALPLEVLALIEQFSHEHKQFDVGFIGTASADMKAREECVQAIEMNFSKCVLSLKQLNGTIMGRQHYYRALQTCRVVVSLPGAGWDTFRYWENAAMSGAAISAALPITIPHKFSEHEIGTFTDAEDMVVQIERAICKPVLLRRTHLIEKHTTQARAQQVLTALKEPLSTRI